MKRLKIAVSLFLVMLISIFQIIIFAENDIKISDWALVGVEEARNYNLIISDLGNDYTRNISREEFCRLIVHLVETTTGKELESGINPFSDTYSEDVIKAFSNGIVSGTSKTQFTPNANISRQEMSIMLVKAIKLIENETKNFLFSDIDAISTVFSDEHLIAKWALKEVKMINKYSILSGVGENKVDPLGNATIEQSLILIKKVFSFFIKENNSVKLKETINFVDGFDATSFYNNVSESEIDSNNQQRLTFVKIPSFIDEMEIGEILFVETSVENPYGFIGEIVEKKITNDSEVVIFRTPLIDEVFEELSIRFNNNLSLSNIIAYDVPENINLLAVIDDKKFSMDSIIANNFENENSSYLESPNLLNDNKAEIYATMNGLMEVEFGIKNVVFYDKDDNRSTVYDQIRLNGGVTLRNITLDGVLDYNKNKIKEISLISSIEEVEFDISADFGLDKEFNFDKVRNTVNGGNGYDFGIMKIEGVDMSNTFVIGSITFDLTTLSVIPSTGKVHKMPLAAVLMFTADINGNINSTISTSLNYKTKVVKGISVKNKSLKNNSEIDTMSYALVKEYGDDKYEVKEYDLFRANDEVTFTVNGSAKGELEFTFGPEIGLMIGGIMPITIKNHGGIATSFNGSGFDIRCINGNWDVEGPELSAKIEINKSLNILIRLIAEIRILPFVKGVYGFDYKLPLSDKVLWSKEISNSQFPSIDDIYSEVNSLNKYIDKNRALTIGGSEDSKTRGYFDENSNLMAVQQKFSTGVVETYYYLKDGSIFYIHANPYSSDKSEYLILNGKGYLYENDNFNIKEYLDDVVDKTSFFVKQLDSKVAYVYEEFKKIKNGDRDYVGITFEQMVFMYGDTYIIYGWSGSLFLHYKEKNINVMFDFFDSYDVHSGPNDFGIYDSAKILPYIEPQ